MVVYALFRSGTAVDMRDKFVDYQKKQAAENKADRRRNKREFSETFTCAVD